MFRTASLAIAFSAAAVATPASAASVAYLSRTGAGATCSLASPCASMILALSAAGAGGEVVCLDKGVYGGVGTFTQSVMISCGQGLWEAPQGVVTINTGAGADVVIEGLVNDGVSSIGTAMSFSGQGSLRLRNVRIGGNPGTNAHGLIFQPTGPGTLHVIDSVFDNNGGAGIYILPQSGGYANVHVSNSKFMRNQHGLFADGSQSTTGVNVNISDSATSENSGNGFGASSIAGKAPVTMSILNSRVSGNLANGLGAAGVAVSGAGSATITIGSSMITANGNGLATAGSGQILTYGNNQLRFNGSNGAFTGNVGLQ